MSVLDPKIEAALNKQINQEMAAAYNYFAMASYFEHNNLKGFASWMLQQRTEELTHAMRIYDYMHDRGGKVEFAAVEKPVTHFDSVEAVFEKALEQERANTAVINETYGLAVELKDYATQSQMQWFVDEQVEEEATVGEALSMVQLAGENRSALLVLNEQFGTRGAPSGK